MATPTYDLLDSTTLASSASSVTFSSLDTIAAGYRDLIFVCDVIGTGNSQFSFRANSVSSAIYSNVEMRGTGLFDESGAGSNQTNGNCDWNALSISSSVRSTLILQAFDFNATDKHKTFLYRGSRSDGSVTASAVRFGSTSAITSVTLQSGGFASTSQFHLYGIAS